MVALFITVGLHVVIIILLPDELFLLQNTSESQQKEALEVVIESPEVLRYVEVNPEAPENEPDNKNNYSFRSQQAADENPEDSSSDTPDAGGETTTGKIVQGSVEQSEPIALESGTYSTNNNPKEGEESQKNADRPVVSMQPDLPPPPLSTMQELAAEDGSGSSSERADVNKKVVEGTESDTEINLYRTDVTKQSQETPVETADNASQAKPLPRQRVKLPPDLTYGQLTRSKGSVGRRGKLAMDATFSQFGEYEQQFYVAVQAGWYQEIEFYQPIDISARVVVRFRIKSDGTIEDVTVVHSTAGEIATLICQAALTKRSPFRPWTEEMVQVFGRERVMEVAFYYL